MPLPSPNEGGKLDSSPPIMLSSGGFRPTLFKLQHLSTIVEQMKSQYRFIITGRASPVLPLADVNVLSELAHIMLLVVRSGLTPKDVVKKAFEMIYHTGPTRPVLNDAWSKGVPYYAREGYLILYSLSSPG